MKILQFQQSAIDELIFKFKTLWNKKENTELIFQSPTGSGKTFMTTSFIHKLNDQPDFQSEDIAFFWITFSDELTTQSRNKFREYFVGNLKNQLLTTQDFSQGKLNKNDVLFTNWQKLVSKDATKRLLRRPTDIRDLKESGFYFEDIVENTQKDNRKIVLIIDESHKNVTAASYRDVINKINPKLILKVSATPFNDKNEENDFYIKKGKEIADIVTVKRSDVVKEGLIKSKIICQTEEEISKHKTENLDELMIDLAIEKRNKIAKEWKRIGKNINPLVLIQLPNDDDELVKQGIPTKESIVRQYLKKKGVSSNKIAEWFSGASSKINLEGISDNDNPIDFLLFKLAAGTGWDCPRAHILVMFREIKKPVFHTQTLGRILRMAYVDSNFSNDLLTTGYLYTNYKKNEVGIPDQDGENKPKLYTTEVQPILKKQFITSMTDTTLNSCINQINDNEKYKKDAIQTILTLKKIIIDNIQALPIKTDSTNGDSAIAVNISHEINTISEKLEKSTNSLISQLSLSDKSTLDTVSNRSFKLIQEIKEIANNEREIEIILDEELKTEFLSRADYKDIGKASLFQPNFINFMNTFFSLNTDFVLENPEKLENKGVSLDPLLTYEVMVDAIYDTGENNTIAMPGKNIKLEISPNDTDKIFTWKCYEILKNQTEEDARIGNISRSWGTFKTTLSRWLTEYALPNTTREDSYKIFINDIIKPQSMIRQAITYSLKKYKPILNDFIQSRVNSDSNQNTKPFSIKNHYAYTDDYEIFPLAIKSLVQPFYIRKEYTGRINETKFIEYLEKSEHVLNWFKNGDKGKEFLGIKYYSTTDECYSLFYPDWIIKTNNNSIYLLDTKSGQTASSNQTKDKAEELFRRIKELNKKSKYHYVGGIVINSNNLWYLNNLENYSYNPNNLDKDGWIPLSWNL